MKFQEKIKDSAENKNSNIVLALDLPPQEPTLLLKKALRIIETVQHYICAVKINRHLTLPLGLFDGVKKIIEATYSYGLPMIMDCKINDIGATNQVIAQYYFKAGFDAITANPFIGWEQGLKPVFETAKNYEKGVILLVYMSHKAACEGYGQILKDENGKLTPQYVIFAKKALKWKADGAVVGATYPEKIREIYQILNEKTPIYSPGVGAQGGKLQEAIKAGASFIIVGRTITLSKNPAETAKKLRDLAREAKNRVNTTAL
jgi:orotidine-5'-phosphate decarboxylase